MVNIPLLGAFPDFPAGLVRVCARVGAVQSAQIHRK
nr:MAG TPA: hypothetical protein [Caudoviricetes sp.]